MAQDNAQATLTALVGSKSSQKYVPGQMDTGSVGTQILFKAMPNPDHKQFHAKVSVARTHARRRTDTDTDTDTDARVHVA